MIYQMKQKSENYSQVISLNLFWIAMASYPILFILINK